MIAGLILIGLLLVNTMCIMHLYSRIDFLVGRCSGLGRSIHGLIERERFLTSRIKVLEDTSAPVATPRGIASK